MALGGKMNDGSRPMVLQQPTDQFAVANITVHEPITRIG